MELLKEFEMDTFLKITDILNKWWTEEENPTEALKARVVFLYKKEIQVNSKTIDPYHC